MMRSEFFKGAFLNALILVCFSGATALAETSVADPTAQSDYPTAVGRKLGRGLANTAFGWTDILTGIEEVGDNQNFIAGITWGPVNGVGKALKRTVLGVVEVVTFPIAAPSRDFDPLVQPEYPLQDEFTSS